MGFRKSIDTEFGVPATYWNIGGKQEDFKGSGVELTMYGWTDKAARDAAKQPLASGTTRFAGDDYANVADASRANLYRALKATDAWTGAEDVLEE